VDATALSALGGERIDWRHKGFPARFDGWTVAEVLAARPRVEEFATPLMVLDAGAVAHNVATMAEWCRARGVGLAPHGKTTLAPQLIARQVAAGAWGVTAATIGHVRLYRAFGVATIILANELVDLDALAWVAAELRRDDAFRLICFADSVAGVEIMRAGLAGAPRPVDVVVDLGAAGGRTGCRSADEAEAVARAVACLDHGSWKERDKERDNRLRLVGVAGYEGAIGPHDVTHYLRELRALAIRLDSAGLFGAADEIVVTAGGSTHFEAVAAELGGIEGRSRPVRVVVRAGAYIAHDDGHYAASPPLPFRAALTVRARVLSCPEPGRALLDFGKRDAPTDLGRPVPRRAGWEITALADQHAFLSYTGPLAVGDVVECGISHPCTAFDKWRLIPMVDADGVVVDVIRTYF
jgi:D-serine deaminase-like pyridoxal phosphate-dependent protein